MDISFDLFTAAFLAKITEYQLFGDISDSVVSEDIIDGFMTRALNSFKKVSKYDFYTNRDDDRRVFVGSDSYTEDHVEEIVDIVSEGMIVQWLKTYLYKQELLENLLNTRDFTTYSPANLLKEVGAAYNNANKAYTQMIREYSYNHGNLGDLHI